MQKIAVNARGYYDSAWKAKFAGDHHIRLFPVFGSTSWMASSGMPLM